MRLGPDFLHLSPSISAHELALEVLERHHVTSWPTPVYLIAAQEGATLRYRYAPYHGSLASTANGFIITIDKTLSENRRRYTVAHELGHLLVDGLNLRVPRLHQCTLAAEGDERETTDEEQFCEVFASHLLLPEATLSKLRLCDWGALSLSELRKQASRLKVAITTLAWQIVALAPYSGGLLVFRMMGKPTDPKDIRLRLVWGVFPKSPRIYLPKYDAVPEDSPIHQGIGCRTQLYLEDVKLNFGSLRGTRSLLVGEAWQPGGKWELLAIVLPQEVEYTPPSRGVVERPRLPLETDRAGALPAQTIAACTHDSLEVDAMGEAVPLPSHHTLRQLRLPDSPN